MDLPPRRDRRPLARHAPAGLKKAGTRASPSSLFSSSLRKQGPMPSALGVTGAGSEIPLPTVGRGGMGPCLRRDDDFWRGAGSRRGAGDGCSGAARRSSHEWRNARAPSTPSSLRKQGPMPSALGVTGAGSETPLPTAGRGGMGPCLRRDDEIWRDDDYWWDYEIWGDDDIRGDDGRPRGILGRRAWWRGPLSALLHAARAERMVGVRVGMVAVGVVVGMRVPMPMAVPKMVVVMRMAVLVPV